MRRMGVLAVAALLAGASCLRAETLAIFGATIIDGNGGKPIEQGVIVVTDRRIAAVGGPQTPVPEGARKIDAAGKFVIPGLMDANVHLLLDYWPKTLARYEGRYDELIVEAAQVALKNGLTTVFDSWGPRVDLARAQDQINSGRQIGARFYFAGNIVGLNGPYTKDFVPQLAEIMPEPFVERTNARWQENVGGELILMPPEQVRKEVQAYLGKGVDFIKYAVNGHNFAEMPLIAFSARVQQIIVEEAHRAGKIAETHTTSDEGILMALEAGVDLMQHCDLTASPKPIAAEVVKRVAERRIPCALLAHPESALNWFRGKPGDLRGQLFLNGDINERALIKAGALIVLSTDAGLFDADTRNSKIWWTDAQPPEGNLTLMGEAHFNWLLAVEQKGMKPMDALMAATRNIARAYRVDKDLGTIEPHKLADLLILDRNPLASAANYRSISVVIKEGQVIDRDALPKQKMLTADAAPEPIAATGLFESPRLSALAQAVKTGETTAVAAFWKDIAQRHTPLIEPVSEGKNEIRVTFLWRGSASDPHSGVNLEGEFGDTGNAWGTSEPMRQIAGTDVWYSTHRMSDRARFSYQLQRAEGDPFIDPLNPRKYSLRSVIRLKATEISIGEGPGAPAEPFLEPRAGVAHGAVATFQLSSRNLDNTRDISIYTPPGAPKGCTDCDLLLFFDQSPYLLSFSTPTILDNMQAEHVLRPMVAVFVGNGPLPARNVELPPNPKFQAFIRDELLPWLRARYEFTKDPRRSVVAGLSLGGLAAAYTAFENSNVFGNVLSQSGSYWWSPVADLNASPETFLTRDSGWLAQQYGEGEKRPVRFYLEVGTWEGTLMNLPNRMFRDVLRARGYEVVDYQEFVGGHDFICWRANLPRALKALLGN